MDEGGAPEDGRPPELRRAEHAERLAVHGGRSVYRGLSPRRVDRMFFRVPWTALFLFGTAEGLKPQHSTPSCDASALNLDELPLR